MSRVRIGGTGGRRNVGPHRMQQRNSSVFRCALKVVMLAKLFVTGVKTESSRQEQ